jgi:hypothetical protein
MVGSKKTVSPSEVISDLTIKIHSKNLLLKKIYQICNRENKTINNLLNKEKLFFTRALLWIKSLSMF